MASNSVPKTQRAVVLHQLGGNVVVEEIPVVQPSELKPGQVLVKIHASGVCHTDLHVAQGDLPSPALPMPLVGGHEGAGEVAALGPGPAPTTVDGKTLAVGDRVGIRWVADACETCDACKKGYEVHCKEVKISGFTIQGTFQQYAVAYGRALVRIPEGLSYAAAAPILCAGITVYRALRDARLSPGEWVALPGAGGGLGHLALQYARALGFKVLAIDAGESKRALCVDKLGADAWVDFSTTKDLVADVRAATDGLGPHAAVVIATGPAAFQQALGYLRPRGTLVMVGLPKNAAVNVDVFTAVINAHNLVGSYVGDTHDGDEALRLVAEGKVAPTFRTAPLDEITKIYEDMEHAKITGRVVLDMFA